LTEAAPDFPRSAAGLSSAGTGRDSAQRPGPGRLAAGVFALLVIACFVAFFITQRVKHTPTAVQRFELTPSFTPGSSGAGNEQHISFKLAKADQVTVAIVNSAGTTVATLLRDHPVPRYKQFSLRWNGRTGTATHYATLRLADGHIILLPANEGRFAPAGEYRIRVGLRAQDRTVLSPRSFTLLGP
jgi:hypothetical protein